MRTSNIIIFPLSEGIFPSSFKQTIVHPQPKKTSLPDDDFNNFRPISNLNFISKILEKVVTSRIQSNPQYNSIQFRHLYAPANEHHGGAHGEKKLRTIIKYINEKRKKSINYEKVRFQFCSEGVERESGITQVYRERVPHSRRGVVEPSDDDFNNYACELVV